MNDLLSYQPLLDELKPWAGDVPTGYLANFMGAIIDIRFRTTAPRSPYEADGDSADNTMPRLGDGRNGERWFETVNWLVAAREARGQFVMMTLGAAYGAQAVGAYRALQLVNPLPCKLIAVEPEPENFQWMIRHLRDNGIDPDAHWLVPLAVSDRNDPVFFPVGSPGVGSNNCYATNEAIARAVYADEIVARGNVAAALRDLLINNTTGIIKPVHPGLDHMTEIKYVSAVTLPDLVGAFDLVDLIESDIQQSEILVFPPFIDILRAKVRRIHIGTHGKDNHWYLHKLFAENGWQIVFSFEPNARYACDLGIFQLNDGVLTVSNPDLRVSGEPPSARPQAHAGAFIATPIAP